MQAVILAAGKGTRLRPLTLEIPKPMLPVGGKPILEHTLAALPTEVDEAIIVVDYLADQIRAHFGDRFGHLKIIYVTQGEKTGTAAALGYARPHLRPGENFMVVHSDDIYSAPDLKAAVKAGPSVLVAESDHPERFGVCVLDKDGNLDYMLEKPENPPCNLVMTGVYVLPHEIFDMPVTTSKNGEITLSEQVGLLAKKIPLKIVRMSLWVPINNHEEYEAAQKRFGSLRHNNSSV